MRTGWATIFTGLAASFCLQVFVLVRTLLSCERSACSYVVACCYLHSTVAILKITDCPGVCCPFYPMTCHVSSPQAVHPIGLCYFPLPLNRCAAPVADMWWSLRSTDLGLPCSISVSTAPQVHHHPAATSTLDNFYPVFSPLGCIIPLATCDKLHLTTSVWP